MIIAWLDEDYSSEAETVDKETLVYCAVSIATLDVMTMFKLSYHR